VPADVPEAADASANDETPAAIEARRIHVTRGRKAILRGVTLRAKAGDVVGVLGPSGAGKSTLFRALVGELPLDDGAVLLGGRDVSAWPLWRRAREGMGYVPQTPSVLWDLSVSENLRVYHRVVHGGAWPRRPRAGEDEAVATLAEKVALVDRMDVRAGELSGGERRRLEIARALTRSPRVLVCDEPFAGVDPKQAGHIGDMLRELADEANVTVLLADHHVAEALRVCSRAVLLLDGEIAADADPSSFREHPLVVGRYLGSWARTVPPPGL
jgi:lipopolysaccharide export system ATP-binding protein